MNMLEKALEKSKHVEKSTDKSQLKKSNNPILKNQPPEQIKKIGVSTKKADIVKFDWDYLKAHGFIRLDDEGDVIFSHNESKITLDNNSANAVIELIRTAEKEIWS